jgi:hypothetical protein
MLCNSNQNFAYIGTCNFNVTLNGTTCPPIIPNPAAICADIYQPVCGINGVTYSNACYAFAAGVLVAYDKACDYPLTRACFAPCDCTNRTVCATNGATFINPCFLTCHSNQNWAYDGRCRLNNTNVTNNTYPCPVPVRNPAMICPAMWAPVCGIDGNTYSNECNAMAAGVLIAYNAACDSPLQRQCFAPCNCENATVCSQNGVTFLNRCWLTCGSNQEWAYNGTCQHSPFVVCPVPVPNPGIVCSTVSIPVCGVNGITYFNECNAMSAGVMVAYNKACDSPITRICIRACTCENHPVCSTIGITFLNDCWLTCNSNQTFAFKGTCNNPGNSTSNNTGSGCPTIVPNPAISCSTLYQPICGVNGQTYNNECQARAAGVLVAYNSACETNLLRQCYAACSCINVPVCSQNGISFLNICFLTCHSNQNYAYSGPCNGTSPNTTVTCPYPVPMPGVPCSDLFRPVCGINGETFPNACQAMTAGVLVAYNSACDFPLIRACLAACTCENRTVCATNGVTFINRCYLGCNSNQDWAYDGPCVPRTTRLLASVSIDNDCDQTSAPVCGGDNKTYKNACHASKAGAEVVYNEGCVDCDDLPSSNHVNIVCGRRNILYPNPYAAVCIFHDQVVSDGQCRKA